MSRSWDNSIFPEEFTTAVIVCNHYHDVVSRVQTSDTHDRNKHQYALERTAKRCQEWLDSEHALDGQDIRDTQNLASHAKHVIGGAIVWLESLPRRKE